MKLTGLQMKIRRGGTLIPVVFATDGTELSRQSGDKSAYPLYMTIGNIDGDIRAQPSKHAWILVAYLPTAKLKGLGLSKDAQAVARARLFHYCMGLIVEPLRKLGKTGKKMVGGDGAIRHCFPILACYVADHPEQSLVCCTRSGHACPRCTAKKDDFQEHVQKPARDKDTTLRTIQRACKQPTLAQREDILKSAGLTAVDHPFWEGLPYCNIHDTITADVLHQLYQGLIKHAVEWISETIGPDELDARISRLPPSDGMRHFKDGLSILKNVAGPEHKEIVKQLLGCLVGKASTSAIKATRALLDFLYIARYRSHSDETLTYLESSLREFHKHKHAFLAVRKMKHFKLPKLHSFEHYIDCIRRFGTTNNYSTETSERLHIDYVKDAYRAGNKREPFKQMARWLLRREAIFHFTSYINWRTGATSAERKTPPAVKLAKAPDRRNVPISELKTSYGARSFSTALRTFVTQYQEKTPRYRALRCDEDTVLHVNAVDTWHTVKFNTADVQLGTRYTHDIVHARPPAARLAQFDTVLVNDTGAEAVGIDGTSVILSYMRHSLT